MLKVLDKNRMHVGTITDYQDLKIEEDVSTGLSSISFYYLGTETIPNEYYIETEEARYTVKEREPDENGSSYQAKLDLEELQRDVFTRFTAKEKTIREAAELALNGTGWTVNTTITTKRNVQRFKVNRLEVLNAICAAWICEMAFDNLNRIVTLKPQIGEDRGVYFIKGLNLRKSGLVSDSYDYVTRLIPYGEGGLTIEEVNDGLAYIDNFQYSNKIITQIWEDTNYTDAAALKEDAIKKLADMSKPKLSYTADVIDLAEASPDYDIMAFGIGDTIRLYDETTGITDMQRIVKLTRYPDNPAKNSCEIANATLTFEELQDRNEKAAAAWEDVSNTDGTVNGVYVHGISQENEVIIETLIGDSPTIDGIKESALSSVQVQFAQGDSATVAPESGWSSQAPAWDSGKFMWQKTTQVHLDGHTETPVATNISGAKGDTGATGPKGDTGTSVTRVRTMYYLSTSNTTQTGGSWDYTPAQYVAGRYYWKKTMTFLSDGTTQEGTPVLDNALTDANSNAYSAVTSANGKNVNIYQANTPGSTGRVVGDTWFKTQTTSGTTTIVGLYKWDGTEWVQQPLNATVIPLLDAGKIVTGILQAIRIQSADGNSYWDLAQNKFVTKNGVFEGKVTTNSGEIGGWDITSSGITKESGSTKVGVMPGTNSSGTFLYVRITSGGTDTFPFAVYADGRVIMTNATITGAISGSTITGSTITGSSLETDMEEITAQSSRFEMDGRWTGSPFSEQDFLDNDSYWNGGSPYFILASEVDAKYSIKKTGIISTLKAIISSGNITVTPKLFAWARGWATKHSMIVGGKLYAGETRLKKLYVTSDNLYLKKSSAGTATTTSLFTLMNYSVLTVSYKTNSYISGGIAAYRVGHIMIVRLNCQLDADFSRPSDGEFVDVAQISGTATMSGNVQVKPLTGTFMTIASTNGSSRVGVRIDTDGNIGIFNHDSSVVAKGIIRCVLVVPCTA